MPAWALLRNCIGLKGVRNDLVSLQKAVTGVSCFSCSFGKEQWHPGDHQKEHCQQLKGGPLSTPEDLCPVLGSSVQEEHGCISLSPVKSR